MPEYLRFYQSAVDPSDVEEMQRLFEDDVVPAFSRSPGCLGLELTVSIEPNAGGLVEGAAISRWSSLDDMAARSGLLVRAMRLRSSTPATRSPVPGYFSVTRTSSGVTSSTL